MNRTTDHFATDPQRSKLKSLAVRGGSATLGGQIVSFLLNIAGTMVLARLLTPAEHGLIDMVMPIIGFIVLFKDLGLSQATVQKDEITHEQVSNLFWVNVSASAIMMVITVAISSLVAEFYSRPELAHITTAIALGFFLSGLVAQHQAILRRQMRFRTLALIEVGAQIAGILAAVAAALAGASYWALVIKLLVTAAVNDIASWLTCGWRPGLPKRGVGSFAMVSFGAHLTLTSILNYVSTYLANVLIGRFHGAAQLAYFGKARQLLIQPILRINAPLTSVAVSLLSRLNNEPQTYRRTYRRLLEKICMITMPIAAILITDADWIVRLVLGEQWEMAGPVFRMLGVAAFSMPVGFTVGWVLISQGRSRDMMLWGIIDGALTIAVISAGLPWGVMGIAAGYGFGTAFVRNPILFWYAGRRGHVHTGDFYRSAGAPFGVAIVVMLLIILLRQLLPMSYIAGLCATISLAAALTLLFYWIVPHTRRGMADAALLAQELIKR